MVEDRIRSIEVRVQNSASLPDSAKAELLQLLTEIRGEVEGLKSEHLAKVEEAPDSLDALSALEATHPRLANLANRLAVALSNMGI